MALSVWVRERLYSVEVAGRRAEATTAVAAAAAEAVFRMSDQLPEWQNATSAAWRTHLSRVWDFLSGDRTQHHPLSAAVATFLTSPLNHDDGQDGPDDFDRPQTIASYSAALSAITWGVDFAVTAVMQLFDCLDLKYEGEYPLEREVEVRAVAKWVHDIVDRIVAAESQPGRAMTPELIAAVRE